MTKIQNTLNGIGTELTKREIFYLLKRAENSTTPQQEKKEIAKILAEAGLTATYFPTVVEFKLDGVPFAKKITRCSIKRHCLGYKENHKYILL